MERPDDERQGARLAKLRLAPSLGLIEVIPSCFMCQSILRFRTQFFQLLRIVQALLRSQLLELL